MKFSERSDLDSELESISIQLNIKWAIPENIHTHTPWTTLESL